jgi:hypothetical protein
MKAKTLSAVGTITLLGLAACSKLNSGQQDEMGWARAALERNGRIEVVASDAQAATFTVRMKDTGELRVLPLKDLIAGPPAVVAAAPTGAGGTGGSGPANTAGATATAAAPVVPTGSPAQQASATDTGAASSNEGSRAAQGEAATAPTPSEDTRVVAGATPEEPKPPRSESVSGATPGRVLASGPGYSIKAAEPKRVAVRRVANAGPPTGATLERMHEPIICQGNRFLQIDNRNLEFDGDAVSAEDGCEIHITNSRIAAKGVGVVARNANVHIENSDIEGDTGSVDASQGAQVYSASSTFKGLRRRADNAAFHDLGGNAWN